MEFVRDSALPVGHRNLYTGARRGRSAYDAAPRQLHAWHAVQPSRRGIG
jgi:hypothetical protein